jgi:hypothetical protein
MFRRRLVRWWLGLAVALLVLLAGLAWRWLLEPSDPAKLIKPGMTVAEVDEVLGVKGEEELRPEDRPDRYWRCWHVEPWLVSVEVTSGTLSEAKVLRVEESLRNITHSPVDRLLVWLGW